jgi:hypothetical protein
MINKKLEVILLLDHRPYTEVLNVDGWIGCDDKADIIDHVSRALGELYGFNIYYNRSIRYNIFILDDIKSILWSCLKFSQCPEILDYDVHVENGDRWVTIRIIPIFKEN